MTKQMPPVPPANRSNNANRNKKGEGKDRDENLDLRDKHRQDPQNIEEAGEFANVRQNTSNQRSR